MEAKAKQAGRLGGVGVKMLDLLRQRAIERSAKMDEQPFTLVSLSKIHAQFKPGSSDLPYTDTIIVAQTLGAGGCYCYGEDPELPMDILGSDARFVHTASPCIDIALLDAVYSHLKGVPSYSVWLEGSSQQKAEGRSRIIASEIERTIYEARLIQPAITMVGAVGNVLSGLSRLSDKVFATDFDETLIGKELGGIVVEDGHAYTNKRIEESNIALVTGTTFATDTIDDIMQIARANGVLVIMFCETGSNFASELVNLEAHCVISEEYPYYMFPGITKLSVFRSR